MSRGTEWWDKWFLGMAEYMSTASKDDSTKVGAVIVDRDRRVVSVGFNGLPRNVKDLVSRYKDRNVKLKMIVHAEKNAILFACRSCKNCVLYTWPFSSCAQCAAMVIQSGITRCVAPVTPLELAERWKVDLVLAKTMFDEAGVQLDLLKD
jgi:dCMP deaminase